MNTLPDEQNLTLDQKHHIAKKRIERFTKNNTRIIQTSKSISAEKIRNLRQIVKENNRKNLPL